MYENGVLTVLSTLFTLEVSPSPQEGWPVNSIPQGATNEAFFIPANLLGCEPDGCDCCF